MLGGRLGDDYDTGEGDNKVGKDDLMVTGPVIDVPVLDRSVLDRNTMSSVAPSRGDVTKLHDESLRDDDLLTWEKGKVMKTEYEI